MKFVYALTFLCILGALMMGTAAQRQGCICPAVYDPVCSKDGRTFENRCRLSCAGATFAYKGACGRGQS